MKRAVITGASGFVGRHLAAILATRGYQLQAVAADPAAAAAVLPAESTVTTWHELTAWHDVDVVFHLGGLAHANVATDTKTLYEANVERTLHLHRHAQECGVRQFVWLSSIKALGDVSAAPLTPDASSHPADEYGRSKALAERALVAQSDEDMVLSIVRPPLVYGPGVKANFLSMLKWVERGWPLPLAAAEAPRAWLSVGNLLDFLMCLATNEAARSAQIWHVRDAEETSVRGMLEMLGELFGQPMRLWRVNPDIARRLARLLGRGDMAERLFSPLQLDVSQTETLLGWRPPRTQREELAEVVAWYRGATRA